MLLPVRFMCSDLDQIFLECIHNLGVLIFGDPFKISPIIDMHMSVCEQHRLTPGIPYVADRYCRLTQTPENV